MCGIVGYIGPRPSEPVLIGGLEKLEYRGYDSAGVASLRNDKIEVHRSEGKLSNLKKILTEKALLGVDSSITDGANNIGIGHTRWATHGRPTETNAHPHVAGKVCLVHNGIIENYLELRSHLAQQGCVFESETDTEIAAHLINSYLKENNCLIDAVRKAVAELEGSYALVVMSEDDQDRLVVAKNSTPVILGITEKEAFVASDIPAVLEYTRQFVILEDGDLAEVGPNHVYVEHKGEKVEREPISVSWDPITAEKGGYRHFMLKEINEQPQAVTDTFRGRINQHSGDVALDEIGLSDVEIKGIKRVYLVACGTAWHAALIIKFYIERIAKIHCEVDYGSEFRYRGPLIGDDCLFVAISQSGETIDTYGSLQLASEMKARTLAICNVVGSSIARNADHVLYTHAGPEISVASTKAFVTQLVAGYLLAMKLANARGVLDSATSKELFDELVHLPAYIENALKLNQHIQTIAKKYGNSENFLYLGRGFLYPVALEGALKLKEISYLHAEGYPAGEMKHGPIALISEQTPIVVALGKDQLNYDKTMSNLAEVRSRGASIIAVTDHDNKKLDSLAQEVVSVPGVPNKMLPIVLTVPLQLLAYHVAVHRGTDVDQPRNLAKSVTVE